MFAQFFPTILESFPVKPENGNVFTVKEIKSFFGDDCTNVSVLCETIKNSNGQIAIIQNSENTSKIHNVAATTTLRGLGVFSRKERVFGPILLCDSRLLPEKL